MFHPVGEKFSPNHHHVVLMNWARLARFNIGCKGYKGWAIYVENGPAFVVEHRGPGFSPFRHSWPFNNTRGGVHPNARRYAFERALNVFKKLSV